MSSHSAFSIQHLSKSFNTKTVLNDISIDIPMNQSLVIIGSSGSGKSVLLKCILGLIQPDAKSKIVIHGEDLTYVHIAKRHKFIQRFGMLFQGCALFDGLSIWQNITFKLFAAALITDSTAKEIAREKLRMVGLHDDILELYPSQISGGMQKRVAIARAISCSPNVIFFDEPTSGLDPIMSNNISDLIINISKELSATTITVTHDMACMRKIADKVAMLHEGKVIWYGSISEMYNSNNLHLKQFITATEMKC